MTKATAKLMIAIHCGGMPFNGGTIPRGESLGGSESAAYFMAKELVKLGHRVVLFTSDSKAPGKYDDVVYDWMGNVSKEVPMGDRFMQAMMMPWDVVVVQRHPLAFSRKYNSKLNIWWLHDLALFRSRPVVENSLPFIDQVLTVSEFHKRQVRDVYGIDESYITATWNGIDYKMFQGLEGSQREPRSLVFASRPERGLEELVAENGIMEMLPDCKLYVCGYDNTTAPMRSYYEYLWGRCDQLPNVKRLGSLGKSELYRLLSKSMLYVYPTLFEDTSNIMLLESNAVGTPFVGPKDHAALPETGKDAGVFWVPIEDRGQPYKAGGLSQKDRKAFADTIRSILGSEEAWRRANKKALKKKQTWASAAKQWSDLFLGLLRERSSDEVRLLRHFEKHSDIVASVVKKGGDYTKVEEILPDFTYNYRFLVNGNYRQHYDAYYDYEKSRGVEYGPEDLTGNPRFEQTAKIIGHLKPKSILDYGCAHGHYTINLAKRFPNILFDGIDINQRNIDIANKWKNEEIEDKGYSQVDFHRGEVGDIEFIVDSPFDLILFAEVMEHVPNPVEMVEELKKHLSPEGHMLITVPYGPWEAIGYSEHKGWRAHLHHFERADLFDMFEEQEEFNLVALPHNGDLGHYFITFKNSDTPIGFIDYERKFNTQAPRETLSACLIAKDEADSIGKCLKSVSQVADEIIVAIDEKTTDETEIVCKRYGAKTFKIPSALEIGFDEARNLSIEAATMDWILWLDADETLEKPKNILKYLRPSTVTGFGVPQHHFAVEPVGTMKTDYPCRLFRNRKGIRFFGVVHEHPEIELNKGLGVVKMVGDFSIMHVGYSTEEIRRKRFERNYPLMKRDHEKYPERTLGRFLWLRDTAQLCKYMLERNRGRMTPQIKKLAEEGIETFRAMLEEGNIRLIVDSLPFYSECVGYSLNGDGVEYLTRCAAQKAYAKRQVSDNDVVGYFASVEDIKKFQGILTEKMLDLYGERYF